MIDSRVVFVDLLIAQAVVYLVSVVTFKSRPDLASYTRNGAVLTSV